MTLTLAVGTAAFLAVQMMAVGSSFLSGPFPGGKPFQAEFEVVRITRSDKGRSTRDVHRGRIYVDSAGRVASELGGGEFQSAPFLVVFDPTRNLGCIMEIDSRAVVEWIPPMNPEEPFAASLGDEPAPADSSPKVKSWTPFEEIGTREIDGWLCRGYRSRVTLEDGELVIEEWRSIDMGQIVLERRVGPHEEVTRRLSNFRQVEPDPSLFQFPDP